MFGSNLRKALEEIIIDSFDSHQIPINELIAFTENITDSSISKDLSYKILDALALHDDEAFLGIILKEYRRRCMVFSINLREYPDLFSRRIYIPLRYNALEFAIAILSSLRTIDYEDFYLMKDGIKYEIYGENLLSSLNLFDLRLSNCSYISYGKDEWIFDIKLIGLTYLNDNELSMPYYIEDGIGYGIEGMSKKRLFEMLDESIELSIDTHNPIMDDEDFEFYNSDCDALNENATEDYEYTYKRYINN